VEKEFAIEYTQLRQDVMSFAVSLLDHVRTNQELMIISNYDHMSLAGQSLFEPSEGLARIKLAMEFKQKRFIAHPSIQQVSLSIVS
jgi:transient receptor potential cation channel subfamily C